MTEGGLAFGADGEPAPKLSRSCHLSTLDPALRWKSGPPFNAAVETLGGRISLGAEGSGSGFGDGALSYYGAIFPKQPHYEVGGGKTGRGQRLSQNLPITPNGKTRATARGTAPHLRA